MVIVVFSYLVCGVIVIGGVALHAQAFSWLVVSCALLLSSLALIVRFCVNGSEFVTLKMWSIAFMLAIQVCVTISSGELYLGAASQEFPSFWGTTSLAIHMMAQAEIVANLSSRKLVSVQRAE